MTEFHEAVTTLLDAFTSGISIIKEQRGKRKHGKVPIDSDRKDAESTLSRTLKRSRRDVKNAYERDAKVLGDGFTNGDNEARSRLATILMRLNAGFMTIINRFTRGRSSPADYQALINLSNTSRAEAMKTFEQLSYRISQSNLSLIPTTTGPEHMRRKKRKPGKKGSSKSKSTPTLAITPLGSASSEGWVRSKHRRISSSDANVGRPSKRHVTKAHSKSTTHLHIQPVRDPKELAAVKEYSKSTTQLYARPGRSPVVDIISAQPMSGKVPNRQSLMSFASDSTKLGEIPAHRWMRPAMFENIDEGGEVQFPVTTFYPIEPYVEPVKRSMFRRLFRIP